MFVFGLSVLCSCKEEITYVPKYLDADVSFLNGSWEWKMSSTSDSYSSAIRNFISSPEDPSNYCILTVDGGNLQITSSSGSSSEKLKLTGLLEVGNSKIVSFRNSSDQLIRLIFDSSKNSLTTENELFILDLHDCNSSETILFSVYEKV